MKSKDTNSTKVLLARRIKQLRKSRGYTQEELAELIDRDTKHISKLEIAGSYPSIETLDRIASALNVTLKDIFDFDGTQDKEFITEELEKIISSSNEKDLRLVYKLYKCVAD